MTDKTARRKAKKLQDQKEHEYAEQVRNLMRTRPGRAFLYTLLERSHVGHNPHHSDTNKTSFACGELNIGLMLHNDIITHAPDGYITMLKEAEHERRYIDGELGRANDDKHQRDFFGGNDLPAGEFYAGDEDGDRDEGD